MKKILFLFATILLIGSCGKAPVNPDLGTDKAAPEINMTSPDGTTYKLSDLKGKVVLVSFWASWCPYCRKDSPNLVALYNKYKSKGLEVFSVSLDTNKADWEKGIKDDGLVWKYHVSDFKKWKSQAALDYEITQTPYKCVVGKDGTVKIFDYNASFETELVKLLDQ